jgi:hypothetical protein
VIDRATQERQKTLSDGSGLEKAQRLDWRTPIAIRPAE